MPCTTFRKSFYPSQSNLSTRFLSATSFILMTSCLYVEARHTEISDLQNRVTALEQRKGGCGMINPSGLPHVKNSTDLFVFGDLIYWNAHENGLNYAVQNKGSSLNLANAKVKNIHGDWNFGFRVGIGYKIPHDEWDLRLTWLRYSDHTRSKISAHSGTYVFAIMANPADVIAGIATVSGAQSRWRLQLNQLDLDLGKEFFVSKWLTLRPHFGVRCDWVKQRWSGEYKNSPAALEIDVKYRDKWWGIGLEGGIDTQWGLGCGFSLFGNLTAAILYGFHDLNFDQQTQIASTSTQFADLDEVYRISHPTLDLQMGVRWDSMLDDDRFHLGFQVGWEHHIYFSQNQFPQFNTAFSAGKFTSNQGDLTLQGWTFSARLDF